MNKKKLTKFEKNIADCRNSIRIIKRYGLKLKSETQCGETK